MKAVSQRHCLWFLRFPRFFFALSLQSQFIATRTCSASIRRTSARRRLYRKSLSDKLAKLREEVSKENSEDQLIRPVVKDKIEKLKEEFNQGLPKAPNFGRMEEMVDTLKEFSKAKDLSDKYKKAAMLKEEFKEKFEDVINNPSIKGKYETLKEKYKSLKAEVEGSGVPSPSDLGVELKKEIIEFKKEVVRKLVDALKSKGLEVGALNSSVSKFKSEIGELNDDIKKGIEIVLNSSNLKSKIELLKIEVAKAGNSPDSASKNKIDALEKQIKKSLAEAIESSDLKEKYENLTPKISKSDGSLKSEDPSGGIPSNDELRMEVGTNQTFS